MKKTIILIILISIIFIVGCSDAGKGYDSFVSCLSSKDIKFYGSSQCPHCKDQKEMFGKTDLTDIYVECDPLGRFNNPECLSEGIKAVPTWKLQDGSELLGTQNLETLSRLTGCNLNE